MVKLLTHHEVGLLKSCYAPSWASKLQSVQHDPLDTAINTLHN